MELKDYPVTSHFRDIDYVHSKPHSGIDIAAPEGTKIFSEDKGQIRITDDKFLGNTVRLKLDDGEVVVYGHLSKINVSEGQYVAVGECLGESGGKPGTQGCGISTGSHCHISLYNSSGQLIDPTDYVFHHQINNSNNFDSSNMLLILVMVLIFGIYKMRRVLFYGLGIFILLFIALVYS